ncbi:MAG: hypothetical protein PHD43_10095 [Methylococcales bacterium]|nr:hypothetical protein [Methylococcales bacterium]
MSAVAGPGRLHQSQGREKYLWNSQPETSQSGQRGRRRKYGKRLGSVTNMAAEFRQKAKPYTINLYGKHRDVCAYDAMVMLKTLK